MTAALMMATGCDEGAPPEPHFRATAQNGPSFLEVIRPPVYINEPGRTYAKYEAADGGIWRPLRDDAPLHSGYIVGGTYVAPHPHETSCYQLIQGASLPAPVDIVQVGTMLAPPDAGVNEQLPVVEFRPVVAPIRVRVSFFTDSSCTGGRSEEVIPLLAYP